MFDPASPDLRFDRTRPAESRAEDGQAFQRWFANSKVVDDDGRPLVVYHGTGVGVTTVFPGFIRDAGMFADTKVTLPRGAGTRSPEDVGRAVVRAVRKDPAEITVAAFEQAFGALVAGISHPLVASLQRMLGGEKVAAQIAAAQAHKR